MPEPEFIEKRDSFKVIFRNNVVYNQPSDTQSGQQKSLIDKYKEQVLEYCSNPKNAKEIKDYLKIKSRTYISTYIIKPLIDDG